MKTMNHKATFSVVKRGNWFLICKDEPLPGNPQDDSPGAGPSSITSFVGGRFRLDVHAHWYLRQGVLEPQNGVKYFTYGDEPEDLTGQISPIKKWNGASDADKTAYKTLRLFATMEEAKAAQQFELGKLA